MGLAKLQGVLARLYTDASLRERFFADPEGVSEVLGLSSGEAQQLARMSAQQVNFFANSLKRKRLNEAHKMLPLTCRVLGKRFGSLFRRYADTHAPSGVKKHLEDAIAFSRFVEQDAAKEGIVPWVVDLLRYEAAWLKVWEPSFRWMAIGFDFPVGRLAQTLAQGNGAGLPQQRPTIALWFRILQRGQLRHILLPLPRWLWAGENQPTPVHRF